MCHFLTQEIIDGQPLGPLMKTVEESGFIDLNISPGLLDEQEIKYFTESCFGSICCSSSTYY